MSYNTLHESYQWRQQEYEVVGFLDVPIELCEGNSEPMIITLPDGGQVLIDRGRDGRVTNYLGADDQGYGVLELEVLDDA